MEKFNAPIITTADNISEYLEMHNAILSADEIQARNNKKAKRIYWAKKHQQQKEAAALIDSWKSEDYKKHWSETYINKYNKLMEDFTIQKAAYDGYLINCKNNEVEPTHTFYNVAWTNFVNDIATEFSFEPITQYIGYNNRHYAIWEKDPIYLTADYLTFTKDGKLTKRTLNTEKQIATTVAKYTRLFYLMTRVKNYEYLYWLVMHFMLQTINNNDFNISPYKVYKIMIKTLDKTMSKAKPKPAKTKFRHKKLYLEPGFEVEAYKNYYEDKHAEIEDKVVNYLRAHINDKVIDIKSLLLQLGYYEVISESTESFEEVYLEYKGKQILTGQHKVKENTYVKYNKERLIRNIFNKVKQMDEFKDLKLLRKESKQQVRSEWHSLVKEGKSLKEIKEVYPNVTNNAYYKVKSKLKKQIYNI